MMTKEIPEGIECKLTVALPFDMTYGSYKIKGKAAFSFYGNIHKGKAYYDLCLLQDTIFDNYPEDLMSLNKKLLINRKIIKESKELTDAIISEVHTYDEILW